VNALLTTVLAATDNKAQGGLLSFLPMIVIIGGLFYFMTASSRKQKKKQAEMMTSLKVGDDVVTSGGIHGHVSYLEDNIAHVVVDTDVVIRVNKTALTRVSGGDDEVVADVTEPDTNADAADDDFQGAVEKPAKSPKSSKS
jgi:preprotein translocase subunit YajC